MSLPIPSNYYDRFDEAKKYDRHLFLAGNILQSSELNELQSVLEYQRSLDNNGLFVDGQLVSGGQAFINTSTSFAVCNNAVVYASGKNWKVSGDSVAVSLVSDFDLGIWLVSSYVTDADDIALLDPAIGELGYGEAGAARLKIDAVWGLSSDTRPDSFFFALYHVSNGVISARSTPTASSKNPYPDHIIDGFTVTALAEINANEQRYSVGVGSGLVAGSAVVFESSVTSAFIVTPDVGLVVGEVHVSTNATSQRINTNNSPINSVVSVGITKEKTSTLVRGNVFNTSDLIPESQVVAIVSIAGYTQGVDYALSAGYVDWSLGGVEPVAAASYDVVYNYETTGSATAIDDTGFTVADAVVGTNVVVSYQTSTPRIDALCLSSDGVISLVTGVSSLSDRVIPSVPKNHILLALVFQFWNDSTFVQQSTTRALSVADAGTLPSRLRDIESRLVAAEQVADISHRSVARRVGYFRDGFADGSLRDGLIPQTAAVVDHVLTLPVSNVLVLQPTSDISAPISCDFSSVDDLSQLEVTGSLKINQHNQSFGKQQPIVALNPPVNRWAEMAGTQDFTTGLFLGSELINQPAGVAHSIEVRFSIRGFAASETISNVIIDGQNVAVSTI